MSDRTKIVATMLTTVRQIAASDAFARDATLYADIAQRLEDYGTATALRTMVRAREAELVIMRRFMTDLATTLARIPVEAD